MKRNRTLHPLPLVALLAALACTEAPTPVPGEAASKPGVQPAATAARGGEAPPAAELPEAQTLLAKSVAAIGGQERLDAIKSIHYTGQMSIAGQNIGGGLEIWWKDGEFYMETTMVGIGRIRAGKQGDRVWSEDPILGLRELEGKEAEQAQWQSSLFLAADWQRYFQSATTLGSSVVEGARVYDVKLTSASGDEVMMGFAAETGLQVSQSFTQVSQMGNMPVKMKMEDYRDVDGMKIAFRSVTDASIATMSQEITSIEFNTEVDTSRFAMPGAPGAGPPGPGLDAKALAQPVEKKAQMPFGADGKPGRPVPEKKK